MCTDEILTDTVCRAQPGAASRKKLAHLFWRIAQARILKQVEVCEKLASSLMKQTEELTEGLVSIQHWIRGGTSDGQPIKWQQKTLMQQGALELLQSLLEVCFLTHVPEACVKGALGSGARLTANLKMTSVYTVDCDLYTWTACREQNIRKRKPCIVNVPR